MTAVWALDLPTGEKMVLLSLADNANDSGHCWPSMATIAKRAGMTTRGAQKIVQRLCEQGHLTQTIVVGKGANYIVHPRTTFTPERSAPPNEKTHTPERRSDKPSRTIIKDKKATPSHPSVRAKPAFVLPDWVPADAWGGFIEMRKRKRANPTDRAKHLLVAKLQRMSDAGQPPGDVLDQSTANGWTDIYELKGHANGRPHTSPDLQRGKPTRRQVTDNPMVLAFARMAGHIDADGNPTAPAPRRDATGAPADPREYPRPALVALSGV